MITAYSGPFDDTGAVSGDLTYQPYWFSNCGVSGIGGYGVTDKWWTPNVSNLTDIYTCMNTDLGPMPSVNSAFTLILYVRITRNRDIEDDATVELLSSHITCASDGS